MVIVSSSAFSREERQQFLKQLRAAEQARVIVTVQQRETCDHRRKPCSLRTGVFAVLDVDVVHELRDRAQTWHLELKLQAQHLERAELSLVRVFGLEHVEAKLVRLGDVPARRHKLELRVWI